MADLRDCRLHLLLHIGGTVAAASKWLKEACVLKGAERVRRDQPEDTSRNPRYTAIQAVLPTLMSMSNQ